MRRDSRVILFGEALVDELPSTDGHPGGAPFNVACHLRAFGVEPLLISRVGEDPEGEMLRRAALRQGLDTRECRQTGNT
jgi:fructokinase